ncbi:class I SAM-dependent methyltransferase [Agrilutibacter solisilvae]|uniref:Methyltransferase n=1 Tax=Agrilutibacter solisilvae TaxID=2763317 RepID=A0A974Y3D2_9GAMM|nr:class I SAM-dependent methyltransferase [Lysobacter solisilvae]QSX79923.1 methyltransferase [Lysobacter solisilvae]
MLPIVDGPLDWPADGALFLRARDGWPLHQRAFPGLLCEQTFRPEADRLARSGLALADADGDLSLQSLVLVLPPRQRDEARALFARAVDRARPGGRVLACVANDEGAKSAQADLARLAGPLGQLSKHKCRAFWTAPLAQEGVDAELLAQWRQADAPRPIADGRFHSRPGLFAWDRIDPASALLAQHLPTTLRGEAADLGAGFGFLSAELLARCAGITSLDLYEAERRALDLARQNLAALSSKPMGFHWHDVTVGLGRAFDVIVSNPPFHAQGRADRPDIGRRFIAVAAQALRPGGELWIVANRHLPYETALQEHFPQVRTVVQQGGFKVVHARRP